jgi:hypothetical protein
MQKIHINKETSMLTTDEWFTQHRTHIYVLHKSATHNGKPVCESAIIVQYLDKPFPAAPADPRSMIRHIYGYS